MIRVFVADDHAVVRVGLRTLIADEPDLELVGEAEHGWQVLQAEGKERWDVLVLDISLPRLNGMEVLRRIREELPRLRVVVMSMYPEAHYAARMRELGAAAYVSKEHPVEEVIRAIRSVASGTNAASPSAPLEAMPHRSLSPREYRIFTLVSQGASVSEIAAELGLTASTVSVHLHHVKQKLEVRSIGEIVRYAHRIGLLGDGEP
jgi:DNA-binding NarL/FixJ family response regulator